MPARLPFRLSVACLLLALPTVPAADIPPATTPTPDAALIALRRLDCDPHYDKNKAIVGITFGCGSLARDADLALVKSFGNLERLTIVSGEHDITDAGIERLKGLKLKKLIIVSETLTARSMESIATMSDLEHLEMRNVHPTGAGLDHLKKLPRLSILRLRNSALTDADAKHFAGFPALTELKIGSSAVTDAGLKAVQDALPKATVTR
jgi:hypothetical protein